MKIEYTVESWRETFTRDELLRVAYFTTVEDAINEHKKQTQENKGKQYRWSKIVVTYE